MKRFLILLSLLFCNMVYADTINLHWLNEDGTTYQNSTCVIDSDLILPATPPTKYGYTFTGWNLGNYIALEYIESTGTQYIDTGIIPTDTIGMTSKFSVNQMNQGYLAGSRASGSARYYLFELETGSGKLAYGWNTIRNTSVTIVLNNLVEASLNYLNDRKYVYNNTVLESNLNTNINNIRNIYLFTANFDGSLAPQAFLIGKVYSFKISNSDTIVRDFIPVLDRNGVPCMFDKVEKKFYYNQGTGNFIAGPTL